MMSGVSIVRGVRGQKRSLTITVTKEDVDTLKDDWLTDNVSSTHGDPLLLSH